MTNTPDNVEFLEPAATKATEPAAAAPVTRQMVIWAGVIIVVLAFLGSLLGSVIGGNTAEPAPVVTVTSAPTSEAVPPSDIYPAGAEMRAGQGAPAAGTGADGDIYIDTKSADVWVHRAGGWQPAGNIRTSAVENLTGETGAAGATGAPGASGAPGTPGAPGTSVVLGAGAPDPITCPTEGDVFIDTTVSEYYSCVDGEWTLIGSEIEPR